MDPALLIAIIALAMALPGTIDATWNVIIKIRALKKEHSLLPALPSKKSSSGIPNTQKVSFPRPTLASLKKVIGNGFAQRLLSLKKATLFHLQNGVRAACFTVLAVTFFALVSFPLPTAFAPTEESKANQLQKTREDLMGEHKQARKMLEQIYRRYGNQKRRYKKSSFWANPNNVNPKQYCINHMA
jgi:hypothetical protein